MEKSFDLIQKGTKLDELRWSRISQLWADAWHGCLCARMRVCVFNDNRPQFPLRGYAYSPSATETLLLRGLGSKTGRRCVVLNLGDLGYCTIQAFQCWNESATYIFRLIYTNLNINRYTELWPTRIESWLCGQHGVISSIFVGIKWSVQKSGYTSFRDNLANCGSKSASFYPCHRFWTVLKGINSLGYTLQEAFLLLCPRCLVDPWHLRTRYLQQRVNVSPSPLRHPEFHKLSWNKVKLAEHCEG